MQRSLSQKKRDQAAARKQYNNEWQIGLMNAPCADPGFCCYAFFCGQCAAYGQRKLQMGPAWPSQYTCCNGGTCISGRCGEQSNPELCLCCEVVCCFPSAMATTRFMIQDEQRVMNTQCDNCLIGFMLLTQQIAFCLRCVAMVSQTQISNDWPTPWIAWPISRTPACARACSRNSKCKSDTATTAEASPRRDGWRVA